MKKIIYTLLFLHLLRIVQAQILEDQPTLNLSSQALENAYAFDFAKAKNLTEQIRKKYPKHPVVPFLQAYIVSWENFPITKDKVEFQHYSQYMQLGLNQANAMLKKNENDMEAQFFAMNILSLLAMHEAEGGDFLQSVNYGKKAFNYIKKGFKLTDKYTDYHFTTGVYKYFAVQYPQTYPIAKPFMAFFPDGNKQVGLQHLVKASQIARFSKTEALIYLNAIYAKYEQNALAALNCSQTLVNQFPANPFFWMLHCEALLSVGRYAEAEIYLTKFSGRKENIYQIGNLLFKGLLQEKYYKNSSSAKTIYQQVVKLATQKNRVIKNYQAFAYAGLARTSHQEGKKEVAKDFYKKALKISEYEGLKAEAQAYK